jgi:metallophosphoesterase superfamily enzyme
MDEDLARLGRLVEASGALRVLVLGDFFHAAPDAGEPFAARLADWLDARPGLRLAAIPGNHDRHGGAGALPGRVEWLADAHYETPFVFRHEPAPDPRGYVLAGHLHPVVRLSTRSRGRFRLPALWLSREWGVLPSFGVFTGGGAIRPARGDRVFALSPDGIVELDTAAREAARA